jgi:hypothetical protein
MRLALLQCVRIISHAPQRANCEIGHFRQGSGRVHATVTNVAQDNSVRMCRTEGIGMEANWRNALWVSLWLLCTAVVGLLLKAKLLP